MLHCVLKDESHTVYQLSGNLEDLLNKESRYAIELKMAHNVKTAKKVTLVTTNTSH